MVDFQDVPKITTYLLQKEQFASLERDDLQQEAYLALLESMTCKEFWAKLYRGAYSLMHRYGNTVDDAHTNWSADQVAYAEAIADYYKALGWPDTAKAFGIRTDNTKAQKVLSRYYGRNRNKPVQGKRPGQYKKIQLAELDPKQVSRTTYWRARKRGYAFVLIS